MKTYYVEVPITGKLMVEIKAENEKDAINKVLYNGSPEELKERDDVLSVDEMWNYEEKIVEGNVFYGELDRAFAEEIEGEDD